MHSDIHVAVRFHDQSVFAGEELRCTITFRNVANLAEEPVAPYIHSRRSSRRESISQLAAQASRPNNVLRLNQDGRFARKEPSPDQADTQKPKPSISNHDAANSDTSRKPAHRQQRSISIISVAPPTATGEVERLPSGGWGNQKRPSHSRSSTVQLQNGKLYYFHLCHQLIPASTRA